MDFIEKGAPQFKANLHCHSTLSDGHLCPEELVAAYRRQGYSVLAITDHEAPYEHTALSTPDFLLFTGYEAYIRSDPQGRFDPLGPEIHLNLLAREPGNTTFICYQPSFCKYMPHSVAETLPHAGQEGGRQYSRSYIQQFIDTARENGYLVAYNHPCWSMEETADILSYSGIFSLEMFNTGSNRINEDESNGALYDMLLRHGKNWYCHGADDNHNAQPFDHPDQDSFGAWTMVLAPELSYAGVAAALERGSFYASTGPSITALTFSGAKVHLECSPAAKIMMHITPKRVQRVYAEKAQPITAAEFDIPEYAPYVRFTVLAENGTRAETRAFTRRELEL